MEEPVQGRRETGARTGEKSLSASSESSAKLGGNTFHSFTHCLLSVYYLPGIALGAKITAVNKSNEDTDITRMCGFSLLVGTFPGFEPPREADAGRSTGKDEMHLQAR